MKIPVEKNKEYIVEIIDNGFQGEGIAKISDYTIFVANAIKGEKVKIKILKVTTSYAYGKIIDLIEKSENRVISDCATFNKCGGCALRHMKYDETLKLKKNTVISNFRKQGLEIEVKDCIGMENPYNYRNKLQYPVGIDKDGNPVMGVFQERTHSIIKTEECKIQDLESQEIASEIFEFWKLNNLEVYNEKTLKGSLRHIVIRKGKKTNEVMVTLVVNKLFEKQEELIKVLTEKFVNIKTIAININNKNTNVILGNKTEIIYGDGYIEDEILGYKFKISPMSFYQVNPIQTEILYSKAIEYADLKGEEIIFDLYCGIGTIGICSSKNAKKVYGIETIKEAIDDAKQNAKINNLEHAEFFVGDVEEKLPKFLSENNIVPDVVFVDPPRKGVDKTAIETLLNLEPKKIVYVSCNSATLARDLKLFEEKYEIKEATPVDMFPFTHHVECVALLEKR